MEIHRMSRTDVRVAVVGYGYWGSKHARVLASIPDVSVTVVDSDPRRTATAARNHRFECARSLDEVVADSDVVVIATPPSSHLPLALQAIRAGCHVLVEKPLATSVSECEEILAAADENGVFVMTGHTFEHNPAVWKLREIAESGELGEIQYVDSARLNLGLYQHDVNVVWDLAPHDLSIVNFLLGEEPVAATAWGQSHAGRGFEDVAHLQLRYADSNLRAYIRVSWLAPTKVRQVIVVGSEKMAVYDDLSAEEPIRIYDVGIVPAVDTERLERPPVEYRRGNIVSPFISPAEPLALQDEHLIECVRNGEPPRTDGQSGLAVVRVLEAANRSLLTGREELVRPVLSLVDLERGEGAVHGRLVAGGKKGA